MTSKKQKILETALELFARDGYNATSTNKIARQAGVSEGLIFRHFQNKEGLLQAILDGAKEKLENYHAPLIAETDAKEVLRSYIHLPYTVDQKEYDFWRLQFKLKWEEKYDKPELMQPMLEKLSWAFKKMGMDHPEYEAILLSQIIDSIAVAILREGLESQRPMESILLKKYNL